MKMKLIKRKHKKSFFIVNEKGEIMLNIWYAGHMRNFVYKPSDFGVNFEVMVTNKFYHELTKDLTKLEKLLVEGCYHVMVTHKLFCYPEDFKNLVYFWIYDIATCQILCYLTPGKPDPYQSPFLKGWDQPYKNDKTQLSLKIFYVYTYEIFKHRKPSFVTEEDYERWDNFRKKIEDKNGN